MSAGGSSESSSSSSQDNSLKVTYNVSKGSQYCKFHVENSWGKKYLRQKEIPLEADCSKLPICTNYASKLGVAIVSTVALLMVSSFI